MANPQHSAGALCDLRMNVVENDDGSAEILSRLPPGTVLIKQGGGNTTTKSYNREESGYVHDLSKDSIEATSNNGNNSAELLPRLPPGTVLIKQSTGSNVTTRFCSREDSDYVHDSSKDSTETNSSGSSSAASYTAAGKVKRMHRTGRSKKIVEVRRNPVRNKKKKPVDEDFLRPRQRLLSVKRKVGFVVDTVTRKRVKTTPTPYMNTRSVTRKMYTVGATYQAPTIYDATEWKEWPAHGMHERPIWHPQVGLAYEYIDRNFVSLDGQTYREIIDEPVIEVVSVDPNPERTLFSGGKRSEGTKSNHFFGTVNTEESRVIEQGQSFEACMHGSLHSVLAYCSRVVTPAYKKSVDMKFQRISQSPVVSDDTQSISISSNDITTASHDENKIGAQSLIPATSTKTTIPEVSQLPTSSSSSEVSKNSVAPRRTISFTNVRNMQGNILQEVFNRSSKNTLIFLKPTDPPTKPDKISTKNTFTTVNQTIVKDSVETVTAEMSLAKLDDNAISDETLMEMSSIYKKLLPNEKTDSISANTPKAAEDNRSESTHSEPCPARFSSSNQAFEIAKILAEYNEKAARNSKSRKACYSTSSSKGASTKSVKFDKECNSNNNRTAYLSLVEQPKNMKIKKEDSISSNKSSTDCGINVLPNQESSKNPVEVSGKFSLMTRPIKAEDAGNDADCDNRAMDLTTAKPRVPEEREEAAKSNLNEPMQQQWLQELIEDTTVLYCAAAGVHQEDVADYLNTLDSSQSMQWLGS